MRTPYLMTALVTALALTTSPAAATAATLFTPPLFPSSADSFACQLANVGTKAKLATIEILNLNGTVVSTLGPETFAAGESFALTNNAPQATVQYVCRFTVQGKKNFRGSATIFNGGGSDFVAIPAT